MYFAEANSEWFESDCQMIVKHELLIFEFLAYFLDSTDSFSYCWED